MNRNERDLGLILATVLGFWAIVVLVLVAAGWFA